MYHTILSMGMAGLLAAMVLFGRGNARRPGTLAAPLVMAVAEGLMARTVSPLTSLPLTLAMLTLYMGVYAVCARELARSRRRIRAAAAARKRARVVPMQTRTADVMLGA